MSTGRNPAPLMCPSRLEMAVLLRDSGKLQVTMVQPPRQCRMCSGMNHRVIACPAHRCDHAGCLNPRANGQSRCDAHVITRRGPAPKMTSQKIAQLQRMRAEGTKTNAQIAAELGVSMATMLKYAKAL